VSALPDERLRRLVRDLDDLIDTLAPPSGEPCTEPELIGYVARLAMAIRGELTRRHEEDGR
jgi:hypothetical protein